MFTATLVIALGIAAQEPVRDPREGMVGIESKLGVSYPRKDGPGNNWMMLPTCIEPCDYPWSYFAVRYRTFRPDFGFLEFKKIKPKQGKP